MDSTRPTTAEGLARKLPRLGMSVKLTLGVSNQAPIEDKQNEQYLSKRLLGIPRWECCSTILKTKGKPDEQLAGSVCSELIHYCGYQEERETSGDDHVPSPFDDPYVGAALITDTGQLIASHRKVLSGEAHAEVYTLCKALMKVNHGSTARTILAINQAFLEKSWLRSPQATDDFIALFRDAGKIVRSAYSDRKLLLLSTLEPCRDFESNPACSALIAAFAPHQVIYGCDDTNPKGQGRERMSAAGLDVMPNAAVEANLRINSLFYWAVESFSRLSHQGSMDESFSLSYTLANLTKLPKINRDERITLDFSESHNPVHQGQIERRPLASSLHELQALTKKNPSSIALFVNKLDSDWLAMYLHQYKAVTDSYPRIVAISDSTDDSQGVLLQGMQQQSIRVYPNSFRRSIEHAYAIALVCRYEKWSRSCLYMLAKTKEGQYKIFQPRADSHESLMQDVSQNFNLGATAPSSDTEWITKLLIYATRSTYQKLERLFDTWHRTDIFSTGLLSKASIEVFVVCESSEPPHDYNSFVSTLRPKPYRSRVQAFLAIALSPSHLASRAIEMQLDRLDPIMAFTSDVGSLIEDWQERQAMGEIYARGAQIDPSMIESKIFDRLPEGGASTITEHWTYACAALNSVSMLGKDGPSKMRTRLKHHMKATAKEIDRAIADLIKNGTLRGHGLFDVVWRYMAALSKVADESSDFEAVVHSPNIAAAIGTDTFLLRELLLYVCKSQLSEADKEQVLGDVLTNASKHLENDLVLRRIGRLAAVYGPMRNALASRGNSNDTLSRPPYRDEFSLCTATLDDSYQLLRVPKDMPSAICTTLALEGYGLPERDQILNNVEAAIKRGGDLSFKPIKAWRGDKRFYAHVLMATVPSDRLLEVLEAMAKDEDETVRWACLDVAFSSELRIRCLGGRSTDQSRVINFRREVGGIVDSAMLGDRNHVWLEREFISLYSREHQSPLVEEAPLWTRFTLEDFPSSRRLFRPLPSKHTVGAVAQLHPEVTRALLLSRRTIKRVMLVLPPITDPDDNNSPRAANTSTPPLGLAAVASRLAADGHDVTIFDCHRYPELFDRVISDARHFDWIGFGVVMSTTRSTETMARNIRAQTQKERPFIVFGGHAVTHRVWPSDVVKTSAKKLWDFVVLGDGEETFAALIRGEVSQGRWEKPPNAFANAHTVAEKNQPCEHWPDRNAAKPPAPAVLLTSWTDRRMFRDPNDVSFEPTLNRDKSRVEAHVVLARGCDWECGFCTERKQLSGGERRRTVIDVTDEVRWLVATKRVRCVQFIDDNIFPQIAAPRPVGTSQEADVAWVDSFLDALTRIREDYPEFRWRGIFRFEDFWKYEKLLGLFIERLAKSGCILLAFGVERGNETQRNRLKNAKISNAAITRTIADLRKNGIHTKGYFIIGGRHETPDSTLETIDFSIKAGFSLAYFALYKDFVPGVAKLTSTTTNAIIGPTRDELEKRYLRYQEMEGGWNEIFSRIKHLDGRINAAQSAELTSLLGVAITDSRVAEAVDAHSRLKLLGFNFDDLIKYNDHHAMSHAESKQLAETLNFGDRDNYFALVRRAYFEFYLRNDFADLYGQLVHLGY